MELREQAVLFRTGHDSDLLEVELTRRRIPFVKYGGLRYLEAAHVKDFIALLRLTDNPADELSWFRLLQLLDGVGPTRARRVLDALRASDGRLAGARTLAAGERARPDELARARKRGDRRAHPDGRGLRGQCRGPGRATVRCDHAADPPALPRRRGAGLRPRPARRSPHAAPQDVRHFVSELVLDPPASSADLAGPPHLDEDYLVLSTVHSAKGLEWDAVHLIAAYDGNFPADMSTGTEEGIAEERRLFYVALTRPRRRLHVYVPVSLLLPSERSRRRARHGPSVTVPDRDGPESVQRHGQRRRATGPQRRRVAGDSNRGLGGRVVRLRSASRLGRSDRVASLRSCDWNSSSAGI